MTTVNNHRIVKSHSSSVKPVPIEATDSSSLAAASNIVHQDEEIDSLEGEDDTEKLMQATLLKSLEDSGGAAAAAVALSNVVASRSQPKQDQLHQDKVNYCEKISPRRRVRCGSRKRRRPNKEKESMFPSSNRLTPNGNRGVNLRSTDFSHPTHQQRPLEARPVIPTTELTKYTYEKLKSEAHRPLICNVKKTIVIGIESFQKGITNKTQTFISSGAGIPLQSHTTAITPPIAPEVQSLPRYSGQSGIHQNHGPSGTHQNQTIDKYLPVQKKRKRGRPPKNKNKTITQGNTITSNTVSGSVPNPLALSTPPLLGNSCKTSSLNQVATARIDNLDSITSNSSVIAQPRLIAVPCPLSTHSSMGIASITPKDLKSANVLGANNATCVAPIHPPTCETSKPPAETRARVFSVDLDPSTFDFADLNSLSGDHTTRAEESSNHVEELPGFQSRDRGFSFEVFNFATGGDDLLPSPVVSSNVLQPLALAPVNTEIQQRRPRGDSIIFDPSSFQDGGIHEKNALEKARLKELLPDAGPQKQSQPSHHPLMHHVSHIERLSAAKVASFPDQSPYQTVRPSTSIAPLRPLKNGFALSASTCASSFIQNCHPPSKTTRVVSNTKSKSASSVSKRNRRNSGSAKHTGRPSSTNQNGLVGSDQIATLPSSLCTGMSSNGSQVPPTFQLDLLNKDGRIGIYLPEERKLRIARFHAKRKMRIWKKRIKYDCRKKLADSRPRVKGRFVKRSCMDEAC